MKVSELEGVRLDYWVARANILNGGAWKDIELRPYGADRWTLYDTTYEMVHGWLTGQLPDTLKIRRELKLEHGGFHFWPSVDWQHGGPIIASERIGFHFSVGGYWVATAGEGGDPDEYSTGRGDTPLVAAMRAYVASNYGEEVPDE